MTPDISVIIPTFRRPQLLVEAIESVFRQKSVTAEIRVVDDCPFGSAEEAVAPYLDRGVTYLRTPLPSGGRPAVARNIGLPGARAEIIHFLDDNDLAPAGFYADALDVFTRKPEIGVIFGKVAPFGESGIDSERDYFDRSHRRARRCRLLGRKLGFSAALFFHDALLVCGAAMIRKRCAVDIGGFRAGLTLSEDVDFYARAIRKFGAVCLNRTTLHYRVGPSIGNRPDIYSLLESSGREIQSRCRQENGALDFYAMKTVARLLWGPPRSGGRRHPWITALRALPRIVRARVKLRRCAEVGAAPDIVGRVWIHGRGKLRLGDRVRLDASIAPIELFVGPGAELALGDDVLIEGGTSIQALQWIQVGDACRIGPRCKVLDNAYHATAGDRRRKPPCSPVVIEAGAVLGAGAIVLPGARVARGRKIPPGAVVRGRPTPASPPPPPIAAPQPATPLLRAIERLRTEPLKTLLFEIACLRAAVVLRNCGRGARVFVHGKLRVRNEGVIALGAFVGFRDGMIPTELVCHEGARISIGARTYFNYGAVIEAHESVTIGKRCMIASMTRLVDRSEGASGPISIGDDVWIAHGAVIAAGVSIGAGSVVSAGSIVTSDAPANSLVVGNPARCISLSLLNADARETPTSFSNRLSLSSGCGQAGPDRCRHG